MKSKEKLKKDGWVPITDWLPQKITYQLNEEIETLINFIEEKKEVFDHETDNATKPFVIKIPPVGDIGSAIKDFEVQKFLVSLLRQRIISGLYLPVYIRKKNQKVIQVRSDADNLYLDEDLALSDSLNKPDEFQKQIIQFRIINWNKFIKLKDKIEKSKEYKKYKRKKELRKAEIKKLELLKDEKKQIEETQKRRTLITRDTVDGDFYFKNKLIKFENKDTIYYLIFECLYEKGDLKGFCSKEIINKYLVEHRKEDYAKERQKADRIKNGVMSLFRFSNLPQKVPNGRELIKNVPGKGLILYNPPI